MSADPAPPASLSLAVRLRRAQRQLLDADASKLPPARRALVLVLRLVWRSVHSFFADSLPTHASSLSFATILAIVPAAALAFAVADVLGATEWLIQHTIEPFLLETLGSAEDDSLPAGVRGLRQTLGGLLDLVRDTHVGGLGVGGLVGVVLALYRVLGGVDEAFERIFHHRGPRRSIWRRVRAYVVVTAVAPLGLSYAFTGAVLSHDSLAARWMEILLPVPLLRELALTILPPLMVTLALLVMYVELPHAEVRPRYALLGAALAAFGWYGVQLLHIEVQLGVARYSPIYSGFGAFPILMLSIYVSWLMVLLGAVVIDTYQNAPTLAQLESGQIHEHEARQELAVRVAIELGRTPGPRALRSLATRLSVGVRPLRGVLDELAEHGLVTTTVDRSDRHYALAIPADELRASAVLEALERAADEQDAGDDAVRAILEARRAAASTSQADRTIAELLEPRPTDREPPDGPAN